MDFLLGLITGYFVNWIALSALVLLAVICEALDAPKTALMLTMFAAFVAYLFFKVPLQYVIYGSIGYALLGVVWIIWRYRRYVQDFVEKYPALASYASISPKEEAGRIVHWMIVWPVSMASNLVGDLLVLAKSIVTKWLRGIYESIYQDAVSAANKAQP